MGSRYFGEKQDRQFLEVIPLQEAQVDSQGIH
jgi:hypothetical protein